MGNAKSAKSANAAKGKDWAAQEALDLAKLDEHVGKCERALSTKSYDKSIEDIMQWIMHTSHWRFHFQNADSETNPVSIGNIRMFKQKGDKGRWLCEGFPDQLVTIKSLIDELEQKSRAWRLKPKVLSRKRSEYKRFETWFNNMNKLKEALDKNTGPGMVYVVTKSKKKNITISKKGSVANGNGKTESMSYLEYLETKYGNSEYAKAKKVKDWRWDLTVVVVSTVGALTGWSFFNIPVAGTFIFFWGWVCFLFYYFFWHRFTDGQRGRKWVWKFFGY